jgi:hypothetical protein
MAGDSVRLLVGTHKGGFMLTSDAARAAWQLDGPFFAGADVHHLMLDPRGTPALWACVNNGWFGPGLGYSRDFGKSWGQPMQGLRFAEGGTRTVERAWVVSPGTRYSELYAGVDPAALFRSQDGGMTWSELEPLAAHRTRTLWNPGFGGLMVHSIVPHPTDADRLHVGISAAGTFETRDAGANWEPRNAGVLADFAPEPYPEAGQCVHHLERDPRNPDVLYQQNHCGVFRSDDAGANWTDISAGLPSRFGFPIIVHPTEPDTIYVVPESAAELRTTPEGRFAVWRSRDRGAHWERCDRGLPADGAYLHVYRQAATADACAEPALYIGTSTGQLYASLDAGDSWRLLRDHLPPIYSLEAAVV